MTAREGVNYKEERLPRHQLGVRAQGDGGVSIAEEENESSPVLQKSQYDHGERKEGRPLQCTIKKNVLYK